MASRTGCWPPSAVLWTPAVSAQMRLDQSRLGWRSSPGPILRRHPAGPRRRPPARPWQDQPPGTIYRQIAENLRHGQLPPLLILIGEPGPVNLVVLEGHKRLTGLLV